ncbi:MAG: glycoside hydrolase family 13 protein, partial [Clostridia bacterium]|nr:glycoside hydrolase family 13 protein [Clostridia bacterium]
MHFYYDPLSTAFKSVTGGIPENYNLTINVKSDAAKVSIVLFRDGSVERSYPMQKAEGGFFTFEHSFKHGLYWYYFIADGLRFGKSCDLLAEEGSFWSFQLTVYKRSYNAPDSAKGGIIYQIFPDRFKNLGDFDVAKGKIKRTDWGGLPTYRSADGKVYNNEFFGGNFKGITAKLDYLKSLNVSIVYLNPISKAYSSHRYDTSDYLSFDPVLGSEDDLKEMLSEGKKRGISFVFDGVFNHTGADSIYFNRYKTFKGKGAYQGEESEYYNWYCFRRFPDVYESWWGFESLPSIDKNSKSFQSFITEKVIPKYLSLGFSGVRLDVVDELTETFVKGIRSAIKKGDKEGLVIGEVWEDATNKIAYGYRRHYFCGDELDSVMNYPLKDAIVNYISSGNLSEIVNTFKEQVNNFPKTALDTLMNVLSTHDTSRIITVFGRTSVQTDKDLMKFEKLEGEDLERGKRLAKLAYAITCTVYGLPSVYYGDEAGVWGDLDPYNRKC